MQLRPFTRRRRPDVLFYWEWSRAKWQFDEFDRQIRVQRDQYAVKLPEYADSRNDEFLQQLRVAAAINEQRQKTLVACTVLQPTWRDRWVMWLYEWATKRTLPRNRV